MYPCVCVCVCVHMCVVSLSLLSSLALLLSPLPQKSPSLYVHMCAYTRPTSGQLLFLCICMFLYLSYLRFDRFPCDCFHLALSPDTKKNNQQQLTRIRTPPTLANSRTQLRHTQTSLINTQPFEFLPKMYPNPPQTQPRRNNT